MSGHCGKFVDQSLSKLIYSKTLWKTQYKHNLCIWAVTCQSFFSSLSLYTSGSAECWPEPVHAKRKIKNGRVMSRRREQEEMRRPLVSQAEEGQGKSEVNSSLYSAKTMFASILSISIQPHFSPSHSGCRKWPWLNRYMERWALDTSLSAIESQYAARGERLHLSVGMGNRCSQRKGDKGKTNAGWLCIHWQNEMRSSG